MDGLYWKIEDGDALSPLQKALKESWKYAEGRVEHALAHLGLRVTCPLGRAGDYLENGAARVIC